MYTDKCQVSYYLNGSESPSILGVPLNYTTPSASIQILNTGGTQNKIIVKKETTDDRMHFQLGKFVNPSCLNRPTFIPSVLVIQNLSENNLSLNINNHKTVQTTDEDESNTYDVIKMIQCGNSSITINNVLSLKTTEIESTKFSDNCGELFTMTQYPSKEKIEKSVIRD